MKCSIKGVCRGSGKIFVELSISELLPNGDIAISASSNHRQLPVITQQKRDEGETICLFAAFPDLRKGICNLEIANNASKENPVSISLTFEKAKWQSRFNYKLNNSFCSLIRDFDKSLKYESVSFSFWEVISKGNSNILRCSMLYPASVKTAPTVACYDSRFNMISDSPVVSSSSIIRPESASDIELVESLFSIHLPNNLDQSYFFCAKDEAGLFLNGFTVLEPHIYRHLKENHDFLTRNAQIDGNYDKWFSETKCKKEDLAVQRMCNFAASPLFSIIVPLYKTPELFFRDMVDSLLSQTYTNWELILVNASPEDKALSSIVSQASEHDERIRLVTLDENKGISENTNEGIAASCGDFICFFDHDDVLEPNLLFEYAKAISSNPDTDLLYCDEDKLMPDGKYAQPFFKPDFNIDLLRNNNYICHMLAIRKSLYETLEPNTSEFDGAQDHNITLQAVEKARHVAHIPKILYHWRISETSTAANADTKPYATQAGIKAVSNHLKRLGIQAKVSQSRRPFTYKIQYAIPNNHPLVSVIIPTKDHIDLLGRCITSIVEKSTYDNYEIVVVENNSQDPETFAYYKKLEKEYPEIIRISFWPAEFNFSKLMNFGKSEANGDYLLLLNNDTEVITPNWIENMLGIASRPEVGVVGVRLYYPDDTIQHAGLCVTGGVAGHLGRSLPRGNWGYFAFHDAEQNLSAVTAACMMTKREVFEKAGGWTEELSVAFNDVDFCLKAREQGYLVVYTPEVELYHYESVSRGQEDNADKKIRFHKEIAYMNYRWAEYYVKGDPYINPNFSTCEPLNCYYHL